MRVAVFGLGYVGSVSATCLATLGHDVTGVDVNPTKVAQINDGEAPMVEPRLAELLRAAVQHGRLAATSDPAAAMAGCDVALVCVGTPSGNNGALDARHLRTVASEIACHLGAAGPYPVVAIRSTVLPSVVRDEVLPALEHAGGRAGVDFGLCVNPEFLREGSAVDDFMSPPFTLVGRADERSGKILGALYAGVQSPLVETDLATAVMVKYASNAFHALKVCFANEFGALCAHAGVDGQAVMEIFCRDTKLNISPAYLKPGFAFGGSCLPKDLRAAIHQARHADLDLPVLGAIFPSNHLQVERAVAAIRATGAQRVGIVGLSFKPFTDDLRESPLVTLIEVLIGKGLDVRVFDREVTISRLIGRNREYIDRTIPHITRLMCETPAELIRFAQTLVIGKRLPGIESELSAHLRPDQTLINLTDARGATRRAAAEVTPA